MNSKAEIIISIALRLRTLEETLRLITADADAKQAGTKAHLLAWLLKCSPCKTQRELARVLNVTPGRVSQMLRVLKRSLG